MKTLISFALLTGAALAAEPRIFEVRGRIHEVRAANKELVVQHEEIPDFMPAMTMPFRVRDAALLAPLRAGQEIAFTLHVAGKDDWIDAIKIVRTTPATAPLSSPKLEPFQPGDLLPDLQFLDEHGRVLRLQEFRGTALAITFFYTRCPLPRFCPLLAQKFREVQETLRVQAPNGPWRLLSISLDPARDTPPVLGAYAQAQQADPTHWRFATGDLRTVTVLALRAGANFWDESGAIVHEVRTVVVDPAGRVRRVFTDNEWTSEELVRELRAAAPTP